MIRVYLCEDNKHLLSHYTNLVEMYIAFDELNLCLTYSTTDPLKLLMKLQDTDDTGLYFLDISLHASMDGFQLAKKIRALDPRGYIVFITTHSEMMSQTFKYQVEALDFIAKDEPDQLSYRIQQCLRTVAANDSTMQKQFKQPICIKLENQVIMLPSC